MKLMTLKQYMGMSKPALIRKIMKTLRAMPKKRLAMVCYNITKSKLPRLKRVKYGVTKQPYPPHYWTKELVSRDTKAYRKKLLSLDAPKRKTKRKFSRKQLAAQRLFAKRARAGTLRKRRKR